MASLISDRTMCRQIFRGVPRYRVRRLKQNRKAGNDQSCNSAIAGLAALCQQLLTTTPASVDL